MMNRTSVSFLFLFLSLLISSLAGCGGEGSAGFSLSPSNNEAGLESISVTPTNTALAENTSQQFTATGIYSDNTTKDLTSVVIWTSSNEDSVTVVSSADEAGLTTSSSLEGSDLSASYKPGSVKGKQTGNATITAKWKQVTGSAVVTVTSATLVGIAVTPTNPSIVPGTTRQFIATGTFSDDTTQDLTTAVTWDSSDTVVAAFSSEVGSFGLVNAMAAGSTTITATSGSVSGTASLSVTSASLLFLSVSPTNPSIAAGTTLQFTATGTFSDNSTQNLTATVTWNRPSVDNDIASIYNDTSRKGLAAAWNPGSTTITATSGSISGSTVLTVTSATLVSIAVTPTNPSIASGASQQFTATGTYSFGSTQNLTTAVTWSSSTTAVAAISNADGSKGLATSVTAGSTTITATLGSVSGEATLTVVESGSVLLTWDAPTTNTDGSFLNPLTGLATYKIYYGTAPYQYTQVVTVSNPGATTITKELTLSAGTYYIAVTTVNISGAESDYSNEVIKIL